MSRSRNLTDLAARYPWTLGYIAVVVTLELIVMVLQMAGVL